MSQALSTHSSNNYIDDFRTESQLTWLALLVASFAMGAVVIWSVSNLPLLMPSTAIADAPITQSSPLSNGLGVADADGKKVGVQTNDEVSAAAIEATTAEAAALEAAAVEAAAVEAAAVEAAAVEAAAVEAAAVEAAAVEAAALEADAVEAAAVEAAAVEAAAVEAAAVEAAAVEAAAVEAAALEAAALEAAAVEAAAVEAAAVEAAAFENPLISSSATTTNSTAVESLSEISPIVGAPQVDLGQVGGVELAQDSWLLAELASAGQVGDTLPITEVDAARVTPPESVIEKLRREELALLSAYSEELQLAPELGALDSTETPQFFEIFDLLFLYSETSVSVTVRSHDTDSTLRNLTLAQQRGDRIVDHLVLSGLDRSRFKIVAESSEELQLGGHQIAIQATLEK